MNGFKALFYSNLKRRLVDGFALGYNIVFPIILILLLGTLCRSSGSGVINAYSYYVITIIPFCITMGIVTAAYSCKDDAYANTAARILFAPVTETAIVCSKVLSVTVAIGGASMLVYLGASLLYRIPIRSMVILFLILLSFFTCAIGCLVGFGMKNFMVVKNIMTVPIGILATIGGTFISYSVSNTTLRSLKEFSPFTYLNRAMFYSIYEQEQMKIGLVCTGLLLGGILIILLAIRKFRKEEFEDGKLSGYEK
ncbi:ABC transporter, permease protein [Lachnospiraceae bacterium KM106-2]|nr:ABC transporter, permease protein [Lachnospiraceae bacterium KM106-2]